MRRKTVIVGRILKPYKNGEKQRDLYSREIQTLERSLFGNYDNRQKSQMLAKIINLEKEVQDSSTNKFLIDNILSFVHADKGDENYEIFKDYFFKSMLQQAISRKYQISVTQISVRINECCISFLFHWNAIQAAIGSNLETNPNDLIDKKFTKEMKNNEPKH